MTWGRIWRVLFVVVFCFSLLLNAVVVGVGVRLFDRGRIGDGMAQVLIQMPRETRRALVNSFRAERPELRRLGAELRARRMEMLEIATSDSADSAALAAAMEEVRRATTRLQTAAHETMLKTLEQTKSGSN